MFSLIAIVVGLYVSSAVANMMKGYGDNLFSHKCSYLWRFPNQTMSYNELMAVNVNGKTCKAVQLNYIGRHGARFPGKEDFHYFDELRNRIVDNCVDTEYTTFLQNWVDYPRKKSGHVEDIGLIEMDNLGDMYGNALHDLFKGRISNMTIKLSGSNKKRTRTSASEFYKGLTKVITGLARSDVTPIIRDDIMKFYENCPNYDVSVLKNEHVQYELNTFINSSYFQGVIKNVTNRLGMNTTLTVVDILKIFLLCSTDLAVRNNTGWCSIMTKSDIDIINYEGDLWDYYNLMYGHKLIQQITCPLWNDVFSSLDDAIQKHDSNQEYVLGDLRFGHSHTLDPFYAAIGLFRDSEPLRADNYLSMKNRIFYESKVTPFGAHVAFILFNCGGSGPHNYLLKMMVNGKPMNIPRCGSDIYNYLDVKARYKEYIDGCNWNQLCTLNVPVVG